MNQLDHFVVAVPDLDKAKAAFEKKTGVLPADGGPHLGIGTRNALVSFGDGAYLELIAPDPAQDLEGKFGAWLAKLPDERLLQWAIRTDDVSAVAARAKSAGSSSQPETICGVRDEVAHVSITSGSPMNPPG